MTDDTFTPAQQAALRAAAERVCWFDWSGNDMDAIAAIEELRKALASQPSPAATVETCSNCNGTKRATYYSEQASAHEERDCHVCRPQCSAGSEPVAWQVQDKHGRWITLPGDWSPSENVKGYAYRPLYTGEPQAVSETPFADGLKEARDQLIKVRDAIIESGALNNRDKYLDLGIETNRVIDRAWNLLNFSTPVSRPQSGSDK